MKRLKGKVAVVAGATRGAGRGIACMLGEAGATVYCTGRSTRRSPSKTGVFAGRPETIDETAEMVNRFGGRGIPVQVDHTKEEQVRNLIDRVRTEHRKLDVLVNNLFGADVEWGNFWKLSLSKGLEVLKNALHSHIITSSLAVPLMLKRRRGLIVETTDGDLQRYRDQLFFDLANYSKYRIAYAMAIELKKHGITVIALTPGFMRTESILDHFGVTEKNWQEGGKKDPFFLASETPFYVGRAVAELAADPKVARKSGMVLTSWGLAVEYGFSDVDGRKPHWDKAMKKADHPYFRQAKRFDASFYKCWSGLSK
jgi:NAD(P)-dependent dehydrogenase (short-subunit alcohol dehydrogenase family)